jgi:hypothetical protein
MINASAREGLPLLRRDRPLIADRQRRQHAGVRLLRQRAQNAIAQMFARALHPVLRLMRQRIDAPRAAFRAHRAHRANVAFEQPRFVIEAVRIGAAMRAPQAHRKAPAFAGFDLRYRSALGLPARAAPPA